MADLIVDDDDYAALKQALHSFAEAEEQRLASLVRIMRDVRSTAVRGSSPSCLRLDGFINNTEALLGQTVRTLTLTAEERARQFVVDIDEKDEYIY